LKDKAKERERKRRYYERHKDKLKTYFRRYYQLHKDYFRFYRHTAKYRDIRKKENEQKEKLGSVETQILYEMDLKNPKNWRLIHEMVQKLKRNVYKGVNNNNDFGNGNSTNSTD